jgi:DNA-binding transcriptional MerR regulator
MERLSLFAPFAKTSPQLCLTLEPVPEFTLDENELRESCRRDLTMDGEILCGELARLCSVSPDTIRHYERVGVLPAAVRGSNGYRLFPRESVARVLLIRRALAIGFSLAEVARILRQRDSGTPPCRGVRALAAEKLADLDRRIEELEGMREELAAFVEEWDAKLATTRDGEMAGLLESLPER